jgi:hypothetical protein
MQPPMAQPAMPAMRYGGHYQGGGEDLSAYQDTLNAHIYQSLPHWRVDEDLNPEYHTNYSNKDWLLDLASEKVLNRDKELKLKDTIDTLEQSNIILNNPSLAIESFERAMEKLGIQTFNEKPEGMTDDEFTMLKAQQFFDYYGIDPNNLSGAVRQGLIDHFSGEEEEKRYGGDLPEAFWGKAMDYMQGGLSAVGMIPGIGNIADAANTAISGGRAAYSKYQGDEDAYKKHMGAMALNATAMIPGVGQMATMAKGAKGAKNVATAIGKESLKKTGKLVGDSIGQTVGNVADAYKHKGAQAFGDASFKGVDKSIGAAGQTVNLGKKATTVTDATGVTDIQADAKKQIGQTITGSPDASHLVDTPIPSADPIAEKKKQAVTAYGGDPFAHNPLRDFIYGGIAQDGKELPDGMSKEQVAAAENAGMTWDPETKTWSHPTHDQSYINSLITDIKSDHSISGVSEGIGEEGIPGMQQKGTTESGATSYQGVSDAQIKKWQEANNYIISGLKNEDGSPMFTEENPFVPTPENVKLVQQGKNDHLDRALEADPSIKEDFLDADGNFDQEAYYKANHGYYGDGAQAIDGKLGEYTVTDQGITPPEKEDAPVVEIEGCDKEKVAAECAEKGLPFVEDACNCGIAQEEVQSEYEEPTPEFWLQDQIKYTDLVRQKLGLRKYRPWAATFSPETIDATYVDPTRAIAAIQSGAKTAGDSTLYAGAAANRAMKLKAQGQAARSIADVWAQNQEANLQSEMQTNKINTLLKNEAEEKNLAIHNQLHTDNIAVDKEYDNALRDINNKLANQLANSYTNMANTHNMNSLYPQFNIKPGTGGLVEFTNPQELFAEKNVDSRTKEERLSDVMQTLKQNQVDPKSLPKDVWSDLLASDSTGGNSELDEVKEAITQGGYGDNTQTGVLGGYPGTNEEVTRYGGENSNRIAMKGRELRKWFSPLQRGWAD